MIKPKSPPSHSSTETSRALIRVPSPPPSDAKIPPTPSNPSPRPNSQQEIEWQASLKNLEHEIVLYQHRAEEGKPTEENAERVAEAMDSVGGSHTDPKVKAHWKRKAKEFREADPKEREGILEGILKGFLILLTSPFHVVGAALNVAGLILDGVGFALKGIGGLVKKMSYRGGPLPK